MNHNNIDQQGVKRDVEMYGSEFKSTLPQQPQTIKDKRYRTSYHQFFGNVNDDQLIKTENEFIRTRNEAGNYRDVVRDQNIKPLTTMVMEYKKESGDDK